MVVSQGRIVRVDRTASTDSRPATSLQLASDDRRDISSHSAVGDRVCDLGDVAILPGLVNAHTHLEFSDLDSPVGQPGMELAEWIVHVVRARQAAGGVVASPQSIVTRGASEAIEGGTALIGEIASTPWPGINQQHTRGGEVVAFAEVLGLTKVRGEAKFGLAGEHLDSLGELAGVSPHAPYSTPLELIERCVKLSRDRACPLAMHVAESPAERELLHSGKGPFAESLGRLGIDLSGLFPWPHAEPVKALIERLAKAPSSLLVHGNDLQPSEIDLLSRSPSVSVVYCPRTHAFFQHHRHPVADLIAAGVNVALGTDSRASNPDLQLWREVRFLLEHRQDLDPANVLQMATLNGARAMRLDHRFGTLTAGRDAVFACVPSTARTVDQLYADFACFDASSADALHS
ncbi:MAG: amidohydrolase family protein [Rhodopirellula sp. JB044]|uniref:amidohydrolase family protein n=1 Tax=Rhodopirellula sp. JB044 TaxID=3342844 RepID=UPI00370ADFDD